jgi:hypothetical protein
MKMIRVSIVENSWVARVASWKLKTQQCAIVLGRTIFLHGFDKNALIKDQRLLRHEVCHVLQWQRMGYFYFLVCYLSWSIRYGYSQNPLEIEARQKEADETILKKVVIL